MDPSIVTTLAKVAANPFVVLVASFFTNEINVASRLEAVPQGGIRLFTTHAASGSVFGSCFSAAPTRTETILGWMKIYGPSVLAAIKTCAPTLLAAFAVGGAATYCLGLVAEALVPTAISWFGEVMFGVGTMHAKGGIAATLQWLSTTLLKPAAQAAGGIFASVWKAWYA